MNDDDDNDNEWADENFLDAVIQFSDLVSSSTSTSSNPQHKPEGSTVNYSPPRQLSQRLPVHDGDLINPFDWDFAPLLHGNDTFIQGDSFHDVKQLITREQSSQHVRKADKKKEPLKPTIPHTGKNKELPRPTFSQTDKKKEPLRPTIPHTGKNKEPSKPTFSQTDKKKESLKPTFPQTGIIKEPPKPTFPQIELKDADVQHRYGKNLEHQAHTQDTSQLTLGFENGNSVNDQFGSRITVVAPTCTSVGVQTDKSESPAPLPVKNDASTSQHKRSKLLAVWDSPISQGSQRNLVSELLVACETDLGVLFGCLGFSSTTTSSQVDQKPPAQSADADKVFNLYSMLTKIASGMVKLDDVVEALVDLCRVDNDVILYRSLRVLHKTLNYIYCVDVRSNRRDNVLVEGSWSGNKTPGAFGFQLDEFSDSSLAAFITGLSGSESIYKKEPGAHRCALSTSCLDWVSVLDLISRIAARSAEECIRLEAVSTMKMILIRSNAYLDRERFGRVLGFHTISHFLQKDSGVGVQKEAVHMLYLLLNCPQLMSKFCLGCKEEFANDGNVNCEAKNGSDVPEFGAILEGLAGCVTCDGISTLELKLRRAAITLLAFLASSGKLGFEILLAQRVLKRSNYLEMILQMLVSETDAEASISEPSEVLKERTLLMRETLIFLNRLVSNPLFSSPVLQVLTGNRGTACLAVDIANRLSIESKFCWLSDSMTRQLRESEIVELARVFRKRLFAYLENGSP